jgi:hypothetical protein
MDAGWFFEQQWRGLVGGRLRGRQGGNGRDPRSPIVDLLAARLRTPWQIEQHLTLALDTGYQASGKPVGEAIVDSVLSNGFQVVPGSRVRLSAARKVTVAHRVGAAISGGNEPGVQSSGSDHDGSFS